MEIVYLYIWLVFQEQRNFCFGSSIHALQSDKRVLTENPFWIKQLTFKCHKSWDIPIHGQWVNGSSNPLTIICIAHSVTGWWVLGTRYIFGDATAKSRKLCGPSMSYRAFNFSKNYWVMAQEPIYKTSRSF